ncbi:MAG: putative ribonuclease, partial [Friedmanniella sp.]|nr:putative ribonuclease [Friedmanniella sp.]
KRPARKAAAKRTTKKAVAAAQPDLTELAPAESGSAESGSSESGSAPVADAPPAPARTRAPRKRAAKKSSPAAEQSVSDLLAESGMTTDAAAPVEVDRAAVAGLSSMFSAAPVPHQTTMSDSVYDYEPPVGEPDTDDVAPAPAGVEPESTAPVVDEAVAAPSEATAPDVTDVTDEKVDDEGPQDEDAHDEGTDEDDSDEDDEPGQGESDPSGRDSDGRRRRRRRGGRRRRRGGSDDDSRDSSDGLEPADEADEASPPQAGRDHTRPDAAPEDEDSTDDSADEAGEDSAEGDGEGRSRRRRRRRSRRGEDSGGASDDPVEVVTRVREPRARQARPSNEVTGIEGSTRMEAKRQRRREGREAGRRRAPILSEAEFLARREAVSRKMIIRQREDLSQIAVLEDGVLVEHYVDRDSAASLLGNVYLGRVQNVLPSMEAAFIDIGRGRNAVLYAGEVDWDSFGAEGQGRKVERVLKSGQPILVQVSKDPVGAKGARLTNHVSIPGRYIVYAPGGHLSGISRKLPDVERKRLKDILSDLVGESASVIVRTAAEGASEDELVRDVNRLKAQWEDIERKVKAGNAPQLLYGEPDLTVRIVRDLFTEDFSDLLIQGNGLANDAYDAVDGYVSHVAPHLAERMSRWDSEEEGDIFAAHRLDEQIAKGLERKVFLPSGGSLVIDRTEAMTVIDVNTGKFTGSGGNLEATVTSNNLEAAEEIVRQLRLRDIGGIIVIDFIDMVLPNNRELLLRRLVECLGRDRTRHQVAEITSLGLVQMTRKKIGTGLLEAFGSECEHCHGRGYELHDVPVETQKQADGGTRDPRPRDHRRGAGNAPQSSGSGSGNSTSSSQGGGRQSEPTPSSEAPTTDAEPAAQETGSTGSGRSRGRGRGRRSGGSGSGSSDSGSSPVESSDAVAEAPEVKTSPVETPAFEAPEVETSPVETSTAEVPAWGIPAAVEPETATADPAQDTPVAEDPTPEPEAAPRRRTGRRRAATREQGAPSVQAEPLVLTEPALQVEPLVQAASIVEAEPVAEPDTATSGEVHSEPHVEPEAAPVAEAESAVEADPTDASDPAVEADPTDASDPAVESDLAVEAHPSVEADPAVEVEPGEPAPAADPQGEPAPLS